MYIYYSYFESPTALAFFVLYRSCAIINLYMISFHSVDILILLKETVIRHLYL